MSGMATTLTASSVSARLRRAGLNPLGSGTSRQREGLRVSQNTWGVRVVADLDSEREAQLMSELAEAALAAHRYVIRRTGSAGFYVTAAA